MIMYLQHYYTTRYQYIKVIGRGTFSQLIEAEDTFHPAKVRLAIKVMRAQPSYAEIGMHVCCDVLRIAFTSVAGEQVH